MKQPRDITDGHVRLFYSPTYMYILNKTRKTGINHEKAQITRSNMKCVFVGIILQSYKPMLKKSYQKILEEGSPNFIVCDAMESTLSFEIHYKKCRLIATHSRRERSLFTEESRQAKIVTRK